MRHSEAAGTKTAQETNLFDEGEDILEGTPESLFIDSMITSRQMADYFSTKSVFRSIRQTKKGPTIREVIVDRVLFRGQLAKEQLGQIRNTCIFIFNTLGHFTKLTFHLDHPIQNQMRQNHKRILLDDDAAVRKALV